jgi:phosphoribosylamine---glycine ligase
MKILFISTDCIAIGLAHKLKKEGNDIKLFIKEKKSGANLDNIVEKTKDWKKELSWVGKEGLIIFDDIGWGKEVKKLKLSGYKVVGGCDISDKIEIEREFGQKIFKEYGLKTVPLKDFDDIEEAIYFVKKNPSKWVIKHNNHDSKFLTYIGRFDNGKDVISVLKNYLQNKYLDRQTISLHERVDGIEIGVGRYFNGKDWVGPIEMNVEHTRFFPDDIGPVTSEMGTLAWYDNDIKNNKLFNDVLDKLKPFLQKINFNGDFEINCIVNEHGAVPLEATTRFGTPIIHLQTEIHESPWADFLDAIASGNEYDLKYKEGYGIVNLLATPPFPYGKGNHKDTLYGVNIYLDLLSDEEKEHIHFEEIAMRADDKNFGQLYISNNDGYNMYTTATGKTIKEAREKSLSIAKKVIIPKVFYRNDIGVKFENEDIEKLKKWGYLK